MPEQHVRVAKMTFAQHYHCLEPKPAANNTKVWVMSSSDPSHIEEFDFLDFIKDAPKPPKPRAKKPPISKTDASEGSLQDQVLS